MAQSAIPRRKRDAARGGYVSGGWVDETFPQAAVRKLLRKHRVDTDAATFCAFLGARLGRYRAFRDAQDSTPPAAQELKLNGELQDVIDELITRIRNLPPATDSAISLACWQRSRKAETLDALVARVDRDLGELRTLLWIAEREVADHGGQPGRRESRNRDALLHDVADRLREGTKTKRTAATCAAEILRACRVPVPDAVAEVEKKIRGWAAIFAKGEK